MLRRIRAIALKEIYHILRDPRTLAIIFVMPVMMVFLYGYALNMDIEKISIGVIDRDKSSESRAILQAFTSSEYFHIQGFYSDMDRVEKLFREGKLKAVLVIPRGFSDKFVDKISSPSLQILVDGSDPTIGNASVNYAQVITATYLYKNTEIEKSIPIDLREQFKYNPELKGSHFIVPGLVAVILMMVCALLTSITISREKETGTMDILLVSPIRPREIIIGKIIPYIGLSLIDAIFILIFSRIVFQVPMRGNLILLLGLSIVFIYCALGIGLFISSLARTQQVAMMAALASTIAPSILLSGFIFPIFSMPAPIRAITMIIPAKYYMEIIRGILLKSSTFEILMSQSLYLFLLGTGFMIVAMLRFKTRVN